MGNSQESPRDNSSCTAARSTVADVTVLHFVEKLELVTEPLLCSIY